MSEHVKHVIDIASGVVAFGAITSSLPPIAAILTIIWTTLRIIETITGKTIAQLLKAKFNESDTDTNSRN